MSGDQFQVTTAALRSVANGLGDRAADAKDIAQKAADADVDTKSWGLLGLGLGLYSRYTSARDTADRSIGEVGAFLDHAQSAVQSTATDYDEADQGGSTMFRTIDDRMGGGGGR